MCFLKKLLNSSFIHGNGFLTAHSHVLRGQNMRGPPENCQLSSILSGAQGSFCEEAENDQALDTSKAVLASQWWDPNRRGEGHCNYDWVSDTHNPGFPREIGQNRLFLVVLQALPNSDSLGAHSWVLTSSSKWYEMLKRKEGSAGGGMVKSEDSGSHRKEGLTVVRGQAEDCMNYLNLSALRSLQDQQWWRQQRPTPGPRIIQGRCGSH